MTETTILQELAQGRRVVYYTVGMSMEPLLKARQTHVVLRPLDAPRNGDIILYRRANGSLVLHRLIRQAGQTWFMRGDNTYGLERIHRKMAFGVVEGIYRNGSYIDVKTNWQYRGYVAIWRLCYPLRFLVSRLAGPIRRVVKGSL